MNHAARVDTMLKHYLVRNCTKCGFFIEKGEKYTLLIDNSYTPQNELFVIVCEECLALDDLENRKKLCDILLSLKRL